MADNLSLILGIVLSLLSLFTGAAGGLAWYSARVKKSYAAERDFGHLKNNYDQLARNIEQLWRQSDERFNFVDRALDRLHHKLDIPRETIEGHRVGKDD